MDIKDFQSGTYISHSTYKSFLPEKVNHPWVWVEPSLNTLLEQATKELGELNAFSRIVPNIDLFIRMHIVKEATDSSRIEGTKTEIDEALMERENIDPNKVADWEEVQNYINATNFAISEMKNIPLSNRLIRFTHQVLMQGVRGQGKAPGEFRKVQNWIGGGSPDNARFVPPEPQAVQELMSDLEAFLHNTEIQVPHLIRIAIAHYQFETIHPFLDGNGRTGRLLIPLYLISNNMLTHPTLYLSEYLERNRLEYFDCLNLARTKNDLMGWIKFFLIGVIQTSKKGTTVFKSILELREEIDRLANEAGPKQGNIRMLFDYLFHNPVLTLTNQTTVGSMSNKTLRRVVNDFVGRGFIKEVTGWQRNRVFVFDRYLKQFLV